MKASALPPVIGRRKRRWLWVVLGTLLLLPFLFVGLLGIGVASLFHLSSDTRAVRSALMQASSAEWESIVALHASSMTLGAVRTGLSFLDLDPQARAAVSAARGAEVSVSRLAPHGAAPDGLGMLKAADACMARRGWDRVVEVRKNGRLVVVYVPRSCDLIRLARCCVVAFSGNELVVVSAKADLKPIFECALDRRGFPFGELMRRH